MNKKWIPYLLIAVLALVLYLVRQRGSDQTSPGTGSANGSNINRNRGFDRRTSYLEYTEHAKCRLQCRKITQAEVEQIMKEGKINYAKSDVKDKPCPTYALEGVSDDGQKLRVVFAQCDFKTKVVTAIDLATEWECHCPGDDSRFNKKAR